MNESKPMSQWNDEDWDEFKQDMRDKCDDELVTQIKEGVIIGVNPSKVSRTEARKIKPILSSDNPSRVWTHTQLWFMVHKGSMEDAIAGYDNALLPAALAALEDQLGKLLPSGNTCDWPPSPYAAEWVTWCINNSACIKTCLSEKVYNLNGDKLWYIGEIANGIINKRIAVKTGYDVSQGGIPVLTYYPNKNWHS